jgi:hypothetical protein
MFLCKPFCCRPEASAEGSPPGDAVPDEVRGDAVPDEVRVDAVPNEVRDASLSLGRTR